MAAAAWQPASQRSSSLHPFDHVARAHPEDLRKLYSLVDEWHTMFDAVTEFDSLSNLASQLVPVSGPA
jgi:hypothetical protein